jgi:hypothetical protein
MPVAALLIVCATLAAFTTPASATPEDTLAAKKNQAQHLESQIAANQRRAEVLNEQYLEAKAAVEETQKKIGEAEAGIRRA